MKELLQLHSYQVFMGYHFHPRMKHCRWLYNGIKFQYESDCGVIAYSADIVRESMAENVRDTPSLGRPCCPGCEPDVDIQEEIIDVRYCEAHTPRGPGLDDELVDMSSFPAGSGEAGGEDNRRWCEFFHKRK